MKTFLNLTNGLLWDSDFDGFIRIQSCHCERKCWDKVIREIDNNFLMWLALGKEIRVVDYSANKDVPRALYQGLEWIWYACQKAWNLPVQTPIVNDVNCSEYFWEAYKNLSKDSLKRLKYFRKFVNDPKKPIVIAERTEFDGDYEFFSLRAKEL